MAKVNLQKRPGTNPGRIAASLRGRTEQYIRRRKYFSSDEITV